MTEQNNPLIAALTAALVTPLPVLAQSEGDAAIMPLIIVSEKSASATTEGSDSYTTGQTSAATRLPLSLRDTPQAVTVLTRQRIEDQQLDSVQQALEATTGISSRTLDSERVSFYSRGFAIDSFQYDGVPTAFLEGASFLDTAFYDRIEVVRGATGLLTGAGNPGASVNLVRKRPGKSLAARRCGLATARRPTGHIRKPWRPNGTDGTTR